MRTSMLAILLICIPSTARLLRTRATARRTYAGEICRAGAVNTVVSSSAWKTCTVLLTAWHVMNNSARRDQRVWRKARFASSARYAFMAVLFGEARFQAATGIAKFARAQAANFVGCRPATLLARAIASRESAPR